jgi:hypothetical protein
MINRDSLHPYISLLFLQCNPGQEGRAFAQVTGLMRKVKRRSASADLLVGQGIDGVAGFLRDGPGAHGLDQVDGFIHRIEASPSWAVPGAGYTDIRHALSIVLRRGAIIAVHCDASTRGAVARWIRHEPRPPLRLVSQNILQGAFLRGEAKGIWLHGTHMRSVIRPDTKHITGTRVQDALSPLEDPSFAMAGARASLPGDRELTALLGIVGTVPRKGVVWNRQAQEFTDFMTAAIEAIELIEETTTSGALLDRPFPILAVESRDLSGVRNAYDILTLEPEDLLVGLEVDEKQVEVTEVLERASFVVQGSPDSADFRLRVDMDGATAGTLGATVHMNGDAVAFNFGYDPDSRPTNPGPLREVLDALKSHDLFAVYYDSGHVVSPNGIWHRNVQSSPFPNWRFHDFSGFDIAREKPARKPAEIHDRVGLASDRSLFGWVARHYSAGWLICDDGSGEVADFVHISPDGVLSLIHVKKAETASRKRDVAVAPFEVVASQAAKSSRHLDDLSILEETLLARAAGKTAWTDGRRVRDRTDFLEALAMLTPRDKKQIVIVQPHASKAVRDQIMARDAAQGDESSPQKFRLSTLETLLHTTRAAAVAVGAELYVVGSNQ